MPIIRKVLGPQAWYEYPIFWYESAKFRWEMWRSDAVEGE